MATFMDIHNGFVGVTRQQLLEAHQRDLELEGDEGVHYERAWLDPESGKVFCLATGPTQGSGDAGPRARRPPDARDLRAPDRGLTRSHGRGVAGAARIDIAPPIPGVV